MDWEVFFIKIYIGKVENTIFKILANIGSYYRTILILILMSMMIYLMFYFNWDLRFIAIITIVIGYITNLFSSVLLLIGVIPIIGPMIVKILTLPVFWLINGLSYFTSAYAIQKGYGEIIFKQRIIILILLFGIILGYVIGNFFPIT